MDRKLTLNQQCNLAMIKVCGILHLIKKNIASMLRGVIPPFFSTVEAGQL